MSARAPQPGGDFASRIATAQRALAEAAARAGIKQDPYQHMIMAQSEVIGLFPELVQHIEAARQPAHDEDMRRAVVQGVSSHAGGIVRGLNTRNVLIVASMLLTALIAGIGGGYWLRGAMPVLVGVRAGTEKCDDRADGSRLCWIPVWEKLPPQTGK